MSPHIVVKWKPSIGHLGENKATDKALVLIYNPAREAFLIGDHIAIRSDLQTTITIPDHHSGDLMHVWLLFMDAAEKRFSNSVHGGMVTVL